MMRGAARCGWSQDAARSSTERRSRGNRWLRELGSGSEIREALLSFSVGGVTFTFLLLVRFVFVDDAGLHDEVYVLKELYVFEGIAVGGDDVGPFAGFDGADFVGPAHEVRGIDSAGLNALQGRHAELIDVDVDLMRVEAVRVDGCVGAEGDFDAGLDGLYGVLLFDGADVLP